MSLVSVLWMSVLSVTALSSLFAEGPGASSPPSPDAAVPSHAPADRPATYGMSVQRSDMTIRPYEFYSVLSRSWPQVPPGPLSGNRETSFPFSFWYYNADLRLRFEFASSRYIAPRIYYERIGNWPVSGGGYVPYTVHTSLPSVSRSVEVAQVLRPVSLGFTKVWMGGGFYHLLRESSQNTGSNGNDYARTKSTGIRAVLRWEIPIRSFALELEGASYSGPARIEPAPYLFVAPDMGYATSVISPGSIAGIVFGLQGGLRLRYHLDDHVSLTIAYERTGELRDIPNYERVSVYARPGQLPEISVYDLHGLAIPASGRVYDHESMYGYSLGVTLQL